MSRNRRPGQEGHRDRQGPWSQGVHLEKHRPHLAQHHYRLEPAVRPGQSG